MKPIETTIKRSTTHEGRYSLAYHSWRGIIQRCNNPKDRGYENYGGRGIFVCDRWLKFENFYEDMGDKVDINLTIERVDNSKGYNPENCIWANRVTQNRNKRMQRNNTTGATGVYWRKRRECYHVSIGVNCKSVHLGYFAMLEQAIQARKAGEVKYWGKEAEVACAKKIAEVLDDQTRGDPGVPVWKMPL